MLSIRFGHSYFVSMRKFQLFCGPSKEQASGIGGIILMSGKLTEIVEFEEWTDIPPFSLSIPPYVYDVKFE